jgi:hypothetical protein
MMTRIMIIVALVAAMSLSGVTAWMSIIGMPVLFPGEPGTAILLGASLQAAKLTAVGWLIHRWAEIGREHRIFLLVYVALTASISFVSAYSYLVHALANEAAPLMHLAELFGIQHRGEEVLRWLIVGVVACTDPFALAMATAVASCRRRAA